MISKALRFEKLPVARLAGHPGVQSEEELKRNVRKYTVPEVISGLTRDAEQQPGKRDDESPEPTAGSSVFAGTLDQANAYFVDKEWSDGLPIVPPTRDRIQLFLKQTQRSADDVVATLVPEERAATAWSIAVNGVMAGCRPEYMPILIALVEAMSDPAYGLEHSGNSPGSDTLIILNGPIIRKLGFNYTQGVMRDGFLPNTSIGRFWRLALRNLAGFLPHKIDKATFGNTWRVVVPENEEVLAKIGWPSVSTEMGFASNDDTVTISRFAGGQPVVSVTGSTPEEVLPYVAWSMVRQHSWHLAFTFDMGNGTL
ncbi:MAG TPA: UGSC family (seleno)protein, partial [Burkholderiales bacterium]|nr:UGSC family (seleno)protein [Burkholderiales bacterium]